MIFNTAAAFESEKERNLYYKFFAGFFFNELVLSYEKRVQAFYNFMFSVPAKHCYGPPFKMPTDAITFPNALSVTFDYHGYLLNEKCNRGELADILIHDQTNGLVFAIEAKFLSDWSFNKDVEGNTKRIELSGIKQGCKEVYQVLLITRSKLSEVEKKEHVLRSSLAKLNPNESLPYPFKIITWQDLISLCGNEKVEKYFEEHVKKDRKSFRLSQK